MTAITSFSPSPQATPLIPAGASPSGQNGVSFGDMLDAVNPLQHIPVLSGLYRAATGSQISTGSQVVGDTLYGALLPGGALAGLASSLANVAIKQVTGKDVGQQIMGAASTLSASATSTASAPNPATPLVPDATPAVAAQTVAPIAAVPLLRHAAHSPGSQYQRAAALDAINQKLLKMAV